MTALDKEIAYAIDLLQECCTALIPAAVTGHIAVRVGGGLSA